MKISALLREAQKGPTLSLDQDLMQRAMLRFPGYDSQQALSLYIADKASQQQKTDAAQNNLITKQQNAISSLGQELQNYEAQAQETDREVERLKQLSGALTTGSADRQQKAKVSADELEKLQKDLEALKTKPNLDPEKYKEIEQQITALANSAGAEDEDVKKLQNLVNNIQTKATINYDDVSAQLAKTQQDLASKEERFSKYIRKTGEKARTSSEEIKKYSDIVNGYKKDIENFDKFMASEKDNIITLRGEIQQQAQEIEDMASELASSIGFVKPLLKNKSATMAKNAIDNAKNSATDATSNVPQRQLPDIEYDDTEDLEPELFGDEDQEDETKVNYRYESKIVEQTNRPVGPVLDHDPNTEEWLTKHLPIMVRDFKKLFALALVKKNPTYNDHQIAYAIEDMIDILFSHEENPISKATMNGFYSLVKTNLFQQAPETSTLHMKQNRLFTESLDKTYSRMLDKIIGLPYI
jgi:chromosome segregation ATPase